jgi:hypothetical protein
VHVQIRTGAKDWCVLTDDLMGGSPVALVEMTRLTTDCLQEHRAYDFADQWDDLIQTVLLRLMEERRRGRFLDDAAVTGKLRHLTEEELRSRLGSRIGWGESRELPWWSSNCEHPIHTGDGESWPVMVVELRQEIDKLPEQRAQVLLDLYGAAKNFDQIAADRRLPLRIVKRFLRESMWILRARCIVLFGRTSDEERTRTCQRVLELDLGAFMVEPDSQTWQAFREHYPTCLDCSREVVGWSRVHMLVREACGGLHRHPSADDLIVFYGDGDGFGYLQHVSLMRHLDACVACAESMALLARFERRPFRSMVEGRELAEFTARDEDAASGGLSRVFGGIRRIFVS